MAILKPFRAIRYNQNKINIKEIITEPYDRITPKMQEDYYGRSPYNVVRIILGKDIEEGHPELNKYKRARFYIEEWLKENILILEEKESLYFYKQQFEFNREKRTRIGLIGIVKLEEFSSGVVLPHERTFPKPKEDRLNLLRATETNTEQIFLLYNDEEEKIKEAIDVALNKSECLFEIFDEDNIHHSLYILKDNEMIDKICNLMKEKVLIIADGHHRYETSLNYRKEKGDDNPEAPHNYIMMTLFRLEDPGLVILPTYRLITGLQNFNENDFKKIVSRFFNISEIKASSFPKPEEIKNIQEILAKETEKHIFSFYASSFNKFLILRLREETDWESAMPSGYSKEWKKLDVAILHSLILENLNLFADGKFTAENNLSYIRNLAEGINKVIKGEYQGIFILNPTKLNQIKEVVEKGELMPEKSTDFFPKLKSGIIMYPFFLQ